MLGPFTSYDALKPGDAHLEGKRSRHRGAPARDCWAAELVLKPPVSVSPCGLSRVRGWAEIILHDVPQDWSWCRRRDAPAFQTLRPRVVLVAARPTRLAGKAEAVPGSPILSPAGLVGGPGGGSARVIPTPEAAGRVPRDGRLGGLCSLRHRPGWRPGIQATGA